MKQKTPFIPREHIESAALGLLIEYGRQFGTIDSPPVPVEEILESHLNLEFGFDDLPRLLNTPDVLGATWVQQRRVLVDQSLDPTVHPSRIGRYRFTIGHELGHWQLHRHFFADAAQPSLFSEEPEPSIVCRSSSRDPLEWQANAFSGYLLMPKELLFAAWDARHGGREPYVAEKEMAGLSERYGLGEDQSPTVNIAQDLAREFHVSGQAMQIRLLGLGLIMKKEPGSGLFNPG